MSMNTQPVGSPHSPTRGTTPSFGTILVGVLLTLGGLFWLLSTLDFHPISLGVALATLLILVGAVLAVDTFSTARGGLIVLGIILTLVLTGMTAIDVPLGGHVGNQVISVQRVDEIQSSYRAGAGNQEFDFRQVAFPAGDTHVTMRLGAGNLTIEVPQNVAVQAVYHVGTGNVTIKGLEARQYQRSGFSVDGTYTSPGFATAERRLVLDVDVGAGNIEVRQ